MDRAPNKIRIKSKFQYQLMVIPNQNQWVTKTAYRTTNKTIQLFELRKGNWRPTSSCHGGERWRHGVRGRKGWRRKKEKKEGRREAETRSQLRESEVSFRVRFYPMSLLNPRTHGLNPLTRGLNFTTVLYMLLKKGSCGLDNWA